jgi:glycosyltransferase involved in cell wall biosynthesis
VRPRRVAIVAVRAASGDVGGAERAYNGLHGALTARGVDCDLVHVVSDETTPDALRASYLRCAALDLGSYFGVITTKAPAYCLRHPNHVVLLMHPIRSFYDMWEQQFPSPPADIVRLRDDVLRLDRIALAPGRAKQVFAIGIEVAERMRCQLGLDVQVLRIPSDLAGLREGPFEHILCCGRLHAWKRVHLVISAMRLAASRVPLRIAGRGPEEPALRELAAGDDRIVFDGWVTDGALADLYARSLAVVFTPLREDLGYVTLEAFACAKPVITCRDSGEPARLVRDEISGLVCPPSPVALAAAIDRLCGDRELAATLGRQGSADVAGISWGAVADGVLRALGAVATTGRRVVG